MKYHNNLPILSSFVLLIVSQFLLYVVHAQPPSFLHLVGPSSVFGFSSAGNALECKRFFDNVTDVQSLNPHEALTFENCVFYFLANRAQQQVSASGFHFGHAIHPIASLPPNFNDIRLLVNKITIQHFQLNEFLRDLNIAGYLEMRWSDARLSWDQQQFAVPQIKIAAASHIWVPYLTGQGFETALRSEAEHMEVRKIEVRNNGSVTAIVGFKFTTMCDDTDFKHFPDDVYRCCFLLEPMNQRSLVHLASDAQPVFTDPKYFRDYGWSLSGTIPSIYQDPSNVTQLNFCLNLQRTFSTLKTELEIPTWACALLLLFSPLFALISSIRTQLLAKMFLLLLQFLTLMLFTQRIAPQMGSASNTPEIFEIHELGMVLNVLSLMFTFSVMGLTKLRIYAQPPWESLITASSLVNRFVYIFDSASDYLDLESLEMRKEGGGGGTGGNVEAQKPETTSSNRFRSEWVGCFLAFHAVGTLLLSIAFLIGYLSI